MEGVSLCSAFKRAEVKFLLLMFPIRITVVLVLERYYFSIKAGAYSFSNEPVL